MATALNRFTEDENLDDFDPAYFPKRVYKDGRGPRVRLMLTDAAPRRALFDAGAHRPRFADLTDARLQDGLKQAADARAAYIARISDAWREMGGGTGGAAKTTAPPADEPDGESPRDAYIRRISSAWQTGAPYGGAGNGNGADAIEGQRRRWLSPGATPGRDAATATKDAAVADRDQAHGEYLDRISNGWRR